MKKESKTLRMAAETKEWVDKLILNEKVELNKIRQGLTDRLEENLRRDFDEELTGISLNLTLNITVGSLIEKAYKATKHYSDSKWDILANSMK